MGLPIIFIFPFVLKKGLQKTFKTGLKKTMGIPILLGRVEQSSSSGSEQIQGMLAFFLCEAILETYFCC